MSEAFIFIFSILALMSIASAIVIEFVDEITNAKVEYSLKMILTFSGIALIFVFVAIVMRFKEMN